MPQLKDKGLFLLAVSLYLLFVSPIHIVLTGFEDLFYASELVLSRIKEKRLLVTL